MRQVLHRLLIVPVLLAVSALHSGASWAQCSYTPLTSNVVVSASDAAALFTFSGTLGNWGVMAVRSDAGTNHDLAVFQNTAASPACVANQVGASTTPGGVDLVVGDFRAGRNATGPWYAQANRVGGAGGTFAEFDASPAFLVVDDTAVVANTSHVVDAYQVFLEGGLNYIVDFHPGPGVDAKVLIFRNPTPGAYWAGRTANLLESAGPTTYSAPASDNYLVLVVNDDGGASTYTLAIEQCQPPAVLASGVSAATATPYRYRLNQAQPYWSAVGVRPANGEDWNLILYKTGRGNLEPECFKDTLVVSSSVAAGVDFVVGDFSYNALSNYYTRTIRVAGTAPGRVEWDDGPDELALNAPPVLRSTDSNDLLECWDIAMTAGQTYTVYFERSGAAATRVFVFQNTAQSALSPYWGARANAVASGTTHTSYTATASGYHAIVVVNDNGATGTYRVGVNGATIGIGGAPAVSGLGRIAPNPAFDRTAIVYSLAVEASVGFDVLDVSGRRVGGIPDALRSAGPGRADWDARAPDGSRLAPGVYFVRMHVNGRPAGIEKLVILPAR